MSLLVVGSVAFDSLETPFGKRENALGGSATYFSICSSLLTDVRLVAVIGDDFAEAHVDLLRERNVDVDGLVRVEGGKTFRWKGRYGANLNEAETLETHLNVFADFKPDLPAHYRKSSHVFLANIHPTLQAEVLEQVEAPQFVALDTMNFWIEGEREALLKVLGKIDCLVINDGEARLLAQEPNIVKAAKAIRSMGPKALIIKRGEYGALYFGADHTFWAPAYPLEEVFDPTGAGDTFAGGFMGFLSRQGKADETTIRQAMIMGCVMASFTVEEFSVDRLKTVTPAELQQRFGQFSLLTRFDEFVLA